VNMTTTKRYRLCLDKQNAIIRKWYHRLDNPTKRQRMMSAASRLGWEASVAQQRLLEGK